MRTIRSEPVLVLGIVQAALALVASFGLRLSIDQTGGILSVSAAALSLVVRSQVSPAAPPPPPQG